LLLIHVVHAHEPAEISAPRLFLTRIVFTIVVVANKSIHIVVASAIG
jgi:hypothetical protein